MDLRSEALNRARKISSSVQPLNLSLGSSSSSSSLSSVNISSSSDDAVSIPCRLPVVLPDLCCKYSSSSINMPKTSSHTVLSGDDPFDDLVDVLRDKCWCCWLLEIMLVGDVGLLLLMGVMRDMAVLDVTRDTAVEGVDDPLRRPPLLVRFDSTTANDF